MSASLSSGRSYYTRRTPRIAENATIRKMLKEDVEGRKRFIYVDSDLNSRRAIFYIRSGL
jgi:hypothetical protein